MKILITGAVGFIGSNFCHWLAENTDHEIYGIDNLSGGFVENLKGIKRDHFFLDTLNIGDADAMGVRFKQLKPDVCYHFAAYAAEGLSPFIRRFNYTNNLVATANIVNLCIEHDCKLIFTSSIAIYSGPPPFKEQTEPDPIDPYGVAKYACEMDIRIAGLQHNLRYAIIRPRNVYGERQNIWDRYRNVLGIWMRQTMEGQPLTIYGDGSQKRSFTYVGDIMRPLYNAIEAADNIAVNLGTARRYTVKNAAEYLNEEVTLANLEYNYQEHRHEVHEAFCENAMACHILGYPITDTPLVLGLDKMWEWAQRQPKRELKTMDLEITKGLYQQYK